MIRLAFVICLLRGHDWRHSRKQTHTETCARCGLQRQARYKINTRR